LNPLGALLLGRGSKENGRERIIVDDFKDYFQIKSKICMEEGNDTGWLVEFVIPFKFLKEDDNSGNNIGAKQKPFYIFGVNRLRNQIPLDMVTAKLF
jgi:hypothetical protein